MNTRKPREKIVYERESRILQWLLVMVATIGIVDHFGSGYIKKQLPQANQIIDGVTYYFTPLEVQEQLAAKRNIIIDQEKTTSQQKLNIQGLTDENAKLLQKVQGLNSTLISRNASIQDLANYTVYQKQTINDLIHQAEELNRSIDIIIAATEQGGRRAYLELKKSTDAIINNLKSQLASLGDSPMGTGKR